MFSARHAARELSDHRGCEVMATRLWMFLSALLLIAAAIFFWRNNLSAAFVSAALGTVAWFLSYRTQLRATTETEDDESEDEHEQSNEN